MDYHMSEMHLIFLTYQTLFKVASPILSSEHLHWLIVGQNHLTQSLFCNQLLNISCNLLNTSCNLLNTVLKMKNRMVVSVLAVYPHDFLAEWDLCLAANTQHHESILCAYC